MSASSDTSNGSEDDESARSESSSETGSESPRSQGTSSEEESESDTVEDEDNGIKQDNEIQRSDESPKTDTKKRPASARATLFEGDWNYVELYNKHVAQFFDLEYEPARDGKRIKRRRKLKDSIINSERAFYVHTASAKGQQPDEENGDSGSETIEESEGTPKGSLWTGEEKEIFFRCLARYTIHRVDEFLRHLPSKSLAEIIAYYELLKRELQLYQVRESHRVNVPNRMTARPKRLRYNYEIVSTAEGISQVDIPIAYEMNEEWIKFEEQQSQHVVNRETRLESNAGRDFARHMKTYNNTPAETGDNESEPLIDIKTASWLSKIYRGGPATEAREGKISPRLLFPSLVYLEEIAKLVTRRIINNLALYKFSDSGLDEPNKVTPYDVWKSVESARILGGIRHKMSRKKIIYGGLLELYFKHLESIVSSAGNNETPSEPQNGPIDKPIPEDIHGVIVSSQTEETSEYIERLVEDGAYGQIVSDDDVNEASEAVAESGGAGSPANDTPNDDGRAPAASTQDKFPKPVLGGVNHVAIVRAARSPRNVAFGTGKNTTDIAIDDALIQKETLALELHDKHLDESIALTAAAEFKEFAGYTARRDAIPEGAGNNGEQQNEEIVSIPSYVEDRDEHTAYDARDEDMEHADDSVVDDDDDEGDDDEDDDEHNDKDDREEIKMSFRPMLQKSWERHSTVY